MMINDCKGKHNGKPQLCRPLDLWPELDRWLWAQVREPGGLFENDSVASSWSPRRQHIVEQAYGQYLGFLDTNGCLDPKAPPADRVTHENIKRFVTQLAQRVAPVSVAMTVGGLVRMLAVLSPETDWAWMRRLFQHLKAWAKPSRNKRQVVVPAGELFDLGIRLMETAEDGDPDTYFSAIQFRDGLMIALLIARPLRIRNFSAIEIGQNLIQVGKTYHLHFPAEETKTGLEIRVSVPDALTTPLEIYLTRHRPELLKRRAKGTPVTSALWVSRSGTKFEEPGIRAQIKTRTKAVFGRAIWPHLFRACAATSMAIEKPEHVRLAAGLLGHNTFATTEEHYILAQMLQAGTKHQQVVMGIRKKVGGGNSGHLDGDPEGSTPDGLAP